MSLDHGAQFPQETPAGPPAAAPDKLDIGALTRKAMHEALRERGRINILIAGRTGVGKSTLINSIFQGNMATTGQGKPVTQQTREFTKGDVPLSIFDSRGLEMADFPATIEALRTFIDERGKNTDPVQHIHVGWICIAEDLRRVEEAEQRLAEMLSRYMPVIAIVTKARADQGFRAVVQDLLPQASNVVRVRALPEQLDDGHTLGPMGLEELVKLTMEVVPEGQRRAFAAAQKVSIDLKRQQAHRIVALAAASAAAVGASPIPFSDAALIVPIQIGMIAGITATFGLSFDDGFLSSMVASVMTGTGATMAGRAIVSGLLKLVPGVGSIAGGVIAAGTAAALTTAFGEAYIAALVTLFSKNNGEPPSSGEVLAAFSKQYKAASS